MPLLLLGVPVAGLSLYFFGNGVAKVAAGLGDVADSVGKLLALLTVLAVIAFIAWKLI